MQPDILHFTLPPIAGQPGQRNIYDALRRSYYWPHMANDIYTTVSKCENCVPNGNRDLHRNKLNLYPAASPLKFFATNILGPLPMTTQRNKYVLEVTDRYSKATRAISTPKTILANIAKLFPDHRIVSFEIPAYLLTDNGPRFVKSFLSFICSYPGLLHLITTAYYTQKNGQAERNKRTIVTRL